MAHVVAEPCVKCRYTECVAVCPVDCFYEGANFLVIHPEECIDCGACVPACPANAIFPEADLPAKWASWKERNARHAGSWPKITAQKSPLPDADSFKLVEDKSQMVDERPGSGDSGAAATDGESAVVP